MSQEDVCKLISLTKKSCVLDPMPTKLLVQLIPTLLPVISSMINVSLQQKRFPDVWKEAIVRPLPKKPGQDSSFTNHRPVSNLAFLSKLTERSFKPGCVNVQNHSMDSIYRELHHRLKYNSG